ncbi:hypothetical protein ACFL00_01655 [Pseudomonadota bacterium]
MPSSTSNFSWGWTWLLVILLWVGILAPYEFWLREHGHRPSVETNQDLWSWYRSLADVRSDPLVLVGASRMQLGLDTATIRKILPQRPLIELSINGQYPMATLRGLAEDEAFSGTVIVSIVAQSLEPVYWDMQLPENLYYAENATLYRSLDAFLTAWLESKFSFLSPQLGLQQIVEAYQNQHLFPQPFYVKGNLDLSKSGDYSEQETSNLVEHFVSDKEQNYIEQPPMSLAVFDQQIDNLNQYIKAIQDRGGQVILLRMPTDKGHWKLDEQYYPYQQYWQRLERRSLAPALHFKQIPGLDQFSLPDSTHLDQSDAPQFTRILFDYLTSQGLILGSE